MGPAYHKGVPLLGVPGKSPLIESSHFLCGFLNLVQAQLLYLQIFDVRTQ